MADKLSDLLDSQRLRPLWQRRAAVGTARESVSPRPELLQPAADLGGPYLSTESPQAVLAALEKSLRHELGDSFLLLGHLMHPLRAAVARVDASAPAPPAHPLQLATPLPLHDLIDRLDDTLTGLLARLRPATEDAKADAKEDELPS